MRTSIPLTPNVFPVFPRHYSSRIAYSAFTLFMVSPLTFHTSIRPVEENTREQKECAVRVFSTSIAIRANTVVKRALSVSKAHFNFQNYIHRFSSQSFLRLYPVSKSQFCVLVSPKDPLTRPIQTRSNRSPPPLSTEKAFCVTLQIIVGFSYLDVRWPYGILPSTIYSIHHKSILALDKSLPPVRFPALYD